MISQYFFIIWSKKQLKNLALSTREVVEILELDKTNIKLGFKTVEWNYFTIDIQNENFHFLYKVIQFLE